MVLRPSPTPPTPPAASRASPRALPSSPPFRHTPKRSFDACEGNVLKEHPARYEQDEEDEPYPVEGRHVERVSASHDARCVACHVVVSHANVVVSNIAAGARLSVKRNAGRRPASRC